MKIGDSVSVLDDAISGVVTAIEGNNVSIITTDDFEIQYAVNELVVINKKFSEKELMPRDISSVLAEKQSDKKKRSVGVKPKDRNQPAMVVDLHIHQLVPSEKGMSNYDMLAIQTETAKRQLDFAIRKRIQKVVFIHGIGEGVLKAELEYLFRRYENVRYYDADYQMYGRGATEVYIFQNK